MCTKKHVSNIYRAFFFVGISIEKSAKDLTIAGTYKKRTSIIFPYENSIAVIDVTTGEIIPK
jgi:hypothetical protein